jgi:hypothetical protein
MIAHTVRHRQLAAVMRSEQFLIKRTRHKCTGFACIGMFVASGQSGSGALPPANW